MRRLGSSHDTSQTKIKFTSITVLKVLFLTPQSYFPKQAATSIYSEVRVLGKEVFIHQRFAADSVLFITRAIYCRIKTSLVLGTSNTGGSNEKLVVQSVIEGPKLPPPRWNRDVPAKYCTNRKNFHIFG